MPRNSAAWGESCAEIQHGRANGPLVLCPRHARRAHPTAAQVRPDCCRNSVRTLHCAGLRLQGGSTGCWCRAQVSQARGAALRMAGATGPTPHWATAAPCGAGGMQPAARQPRLGHAPQIWMQVPLPLPLLPPPLWPSAAPTSVLCGMPQRPLLRPCSTACPKHALAAAHGCWIDDQRCMTHRLASHLMALPPFASTVHLICGWPVAGPAMPSLSCMAMTCVPRLLADQRNPFQRRVRQEYDLAAARVIQWRQQVA